MSAPTLPAGYQWEDSKADSPNFETRLMPLEESRFTQWKSRYAPQDSGTDYDLRGAFKAGLTPDTTTGHWPDTFKKPNHPTFSIESKYAKMAPEKAGRWEGERFIGPSAQPKLPPGYQWEDSPKSPATDPRARIPGLVGAFAEGAVVDTLKGMGNAIMHPIDTVTDIIDATNRAGEQGRQSWKQGKPVKAAAETLMAAIPVIGPMFNDIGNASNQAIKDKNYPALARNAGRVTALIGGPKAMEVARDVAPKVGPVLVDAARGARAGMKEYVASPGKPLTAGDLAATGLVEAAAHALGVPPGVGVGAKAAFRVGTPVVKGAIKAVKAGNAARKAAKTSPLADAILRDYAEQYGGMEGVVGTMDAASPPTAATAPIAPMSGFSPESRMNNLSPEQLAQHQQFAAEFNSPAGPAEMPFPHEAAARSVKSTNLAKWADANGVTPEMLEGADQPTLDKIIGRINGESGTSHGPAGMDTVFEAVNKLREIQARKAKQ